MGNLVFCYWHNVELAVPKYHRVKLNIRGFKEAEFLILFNAIKTDRPARPTVTIGKSRRKGSRRGWGENSRTVFVRWLWRKECRKNRGLVMCGEVSMHQRNLVIIDYKSFIEVHLKCWSAASMATFQTSVFLWYKLPCVSSTIFVSVMYRDHLIYEYGSFEPHFDSREGRSGTERSIGRLGSTIANANLMDCQHRKWLK